MGDEPELIADLLTVIDRRDWTGLTALVTDDIVYHRPGCPPIEGAEQFVSFYRRRCIVAAGRHHIERCLTGDGQGYCWGRFAGTSHAGAPLNEIFADWFELRDGLIARRRTFFYRPAI